MDAFHNKVPIEVKKVVPSKDLYYYNAFSELGTLKTHIDFDLNDADAVHLIDINEGGIVNSIVGKVKYTGQEVMQSYNRQGKQRNDRMREGVISDGSKTTKLTVWGDLIDVIREDELLQIANASAREYNEEIVITTNFSTAICYLTSDIGVEFDENISSSKENVPMKENVICCPEVESLKIDSFLACKNCKKKVIISEGTGFANCIKCNRQFLISLLQREKCTETTVTIDISNGKTAATVTLFKDVLVEFFGKEVVDDTSTLKRMILTLSEVDIVIGKGNKVTALKKHEQAQVL